MLCDVASISGQDRRHAFRRALSIRRHQWGNGSNDALETLVGADIGGFSFDAIASEVKDAVSLSNYAVWPLPSGIAVDDLKATLSNNTSGVLMGKYSIGALKLFAGFEYILLQSPSDSYPDGFSTRCGENRRL